jgi:hypothetical protein
MPAFDRTEDVEDFLHRFVALEEDRFLFTSALDTSGYGWFRFGNVLTFERAAGCRQKPAAQSTDAGRRDGRMMRSSQTKTPASG